MLRQPHMTFRPFDTIPLASRLWPEASPDVALRQDMHVLLGPIAVLAVAALT